jgi:hypothetical protein
MGGTYFKNAMISGGLAVEEIQDSASPNRLQRLGAPFPSLLS